MRSLQLAVLGLGSLMAVAAAEAGIERDLGPWSAVASIGEPAYAVARVDELATVAQQVVRGFVLDDESSRLVRSLYRELFELDLGSLYLMLPSGSDSARWVGIEGQATPAGYLLTLMAESPARDSSALGTMSGC